MSRKTRKGRGSAYGAKVRAAESATAEMQRWMLQASAGGTRPCLQVIRCNDGEQVVKFGLDAVDERPCPHCADIGIESVLYVERVQDGLAGAGALLGHCDGCYERGVKLREIGYWRANETIDSKN
jgi:hypothetical protein